MPDQLKVRLVTPDRILVDQTAEAVEVPGRNGYFEVLYGAAPLLSEIGAGEVRLHGGEAGDRRYSVARGFVEVREGGGGRRIGEVVGGHVDGLHRSDGAALG